MVLEGQPIYPFQWEAVMTNGLTYFVENGEQSDLRKAPCPIRELRIRGLNLTIPFAIPFPLGVEPVYFRQGCMAVKGGGVGEGSSVEHLGYTFFYGWEKGETKRWWEFGMKPPVLHQHGPELITKTEDLEFVGGKPVSEGTKIIMP